MSKTALAALGLTLLGLLLPAPALAAEDLVQAVSDRSRQPLLGPGSAGPAVIRAQILLDRRHFSPGEIDGHFGSNVAQALRGLQHRLGLAVTGRLDPPTWAALAADGRPLLVRYRLTAADVAGPYAPIPEDLMAMARLPVLGYRNRLEALGERFHLHPALLQALNRGRSFTVIGEEIWVPELTPLAPLPRVEQLVVDGTRLTVSLLDAETRLVAQFPATVGSEHDPLPVGDWTIKGVARNPPFHYNPELFWDADPGHAKAVLPPGPNNPVGVVWIDLSKDHYGLHGTPEPSQIGKTQSHGCIRLTNWDALKLADAVRPGLPARLQR